MRMLFVVMVVVAGLAGTQPARAQASASAAVSVTVLDPVGVGEGAAVSAGAIPAPGPAGGRSDLSGSFALDGSAGRTVSVASSAGPLTQANGSENVSFDVRARRTGSGFDLLGSVVARAGAAPGLYAGAVSVIVNYN
jgi:hypothetical protein